MFRFSLRTGLLILAFAALLLSHLWTSFQLRKTRSQLLQLRSEAGYLNLENEGQTVAIRVPTDEVLTWRYRVHIPDAAQGRLSYSTYWPANEADPEWYGAQALQPGESVVTIRVAEDPRDKKWKIGTTVRSGENTLRMETSLPEEHVELFRQSHTTFSCGVGYEQWSGPPTGSVMLVDDRLPDAAGGSLLYGGAAPESPLRGVFVKLETS